MLLLPTLPALQSYISIEQLEFSLQVVVSLHPHMSGQVKSGLRLNVSGYHIVYLNKDNPP